MEQDYHKAATKNIDDNVHKMATELRDTQLLAKLSSGDMVAIDAVYHKHCLTNLFTRYRSSTRQKQSIVGDDKLSYEAIAFAELVSYIEDIRLTDETIVKLSKVVNLYKSRIEHLGGDASQKINATHLKQKLLAQIPDLEAHKSNYEVVFSFKTDIGDTLLKVTRKNHDSDTVALMRAAEIVCAEILQTQYKF